MAAECTRADVRDERRIWHAQRQPRMREQPHRLVFLDETYVNTKMTLLLAGALAMPETALLQLLQPSRRKGCACRLTVSILIGRAPYSAVQSMVALRALPLFR